MFKRIIFESFFVIDPMDSLLLSGRRRILSDSLLEHYTFKDCFNYDELAWKELIECFTKEEIIDCITELVEKLNIPFPYKRYDPKELKDLFAEFRDMDSTTKLIDNSDDTVVETAFEYNNSYHSMINNRTIGIFCITQYRNYNPLSDHFQQGNRYECDAYNSKGPAVKWRKGGTALKSQLSAIWRMGVAKKMDLDIMRERCKISAYTCSQFNVHIAKVMFDMFNSKKVLDISLGWGDRLCGFYASKNTTHLYGFDPNVDTFRSYQEQCRAYESFIGSDYNFGVKGDGSSFTCSGEKQVHLFNTPAEDADYSLIPDDIDMLFSSPPYFGRERYAWGTPHQHLQSWHRYKDPESWKHKFLFRVMELCWPKIKNGGFMCINISDVNIAKDRCYICDDMIEYATSTLKYCRFEGVIGMRLNRKPHSGFKNKGENKGKNVVYMEPIWIFKKVVPKRKLLVQRSEHDDTNRIPVLTKRVKG
jgi:hypothetical protein